MVSRTAHDHYGSITSWNGGWRRNFSRRLGFLVIGVGFVRLAYTPSATSDVSSISAGSDSRRASIKYVPDPTSWLSEDPIIRTQQLRQWDWENQIRARSGATAKEAMELRARFQRNILQAAETPQNLELQRMAHSSLLNATRSLHHNQNPSHPYSKLKVYNDVLVAVDLGPEFVTMGPGVPGERNNIVGDSLLRSLNGSCVIYGAGVNYESAFEVYAARDFQCVVHAFDCTMTNKQALQEYLQRQSEYPSLAFHPWCIGEAQQRNASRDMVGLNAAYDFSSLSKGNYFTIDTISENLGHSDSDIDIFKFDIEGFEWELLDVVLSGQKLPQQLQFELHSQGANPRFVPKQLSEGKTQLAVVNLFVRLWDLGYRVVTKELNLGDASCAEFVLYRFYNGVARLQQ